MASGEPDHAVFRRGHHAVNDPFAFPAAAPPDRGPWFTAAYDSECGGCGDLIEEGDRMRYVDGVVVCPDCGNE